MDDTTALFTLMACIGRVEAGYRAGVGAGPAMRAIDAVLANPSTLLLMEADDLMPVLLRATHPKLQHLAMTIGIVYEVYGAMRDGGEE